MDSLNQVAILTVAYNCFAELPFFFMPLANLQFWFKKSTYWKILAWKKKRLVIEIRLLQMTSSTMFCMHQPNQKKNKNNSTILDFLFRKYNKWDGKVKCWLAYLTLAYCNSLRFVIDTSSTSQRNKIDYLTYKIIQYCSIVLMIVV